MIKYIWHNLGLGDHIICNGLVREVLETCDTVVVCCYAHNENNIKFMYRDEPRIQVLPFIDEASLRSFKNNNQNICWVFAGQENFKFEELINAGVTFDAAFYKCVDVEFYNKFTKFYIQRDLDAEKNLYEKLNPDNEPFIYVQDDPTRGFSLDMSKIRSDLKIIQNDTSYRIFDYLSLLERAEEIHIMESSFHVLIDSYRLTKPKLFLHKYVRNYPDWCVPVGLSRFIEVR
jgi:hypothetical protein